MERTERVLNRAVSSFEQMLNRAEKNIWIRRGLLSTTVLLALVSVYLLNVHMPLILDDFDFMISWATGEMLSGIGDVFRSQLVHYQIWGGRLLHVFTQSFLYLGKDVFNVVNTVMFMLLLLEVYGIAKVKDRCCWWVFAVTYIALMTMIPFFGTVFLWLTGACIYLWGTVFALMPLLIERSVREGGFFSKGKISAILCFSLGMLAGWTNENMTCGMIAVIFLLNVLAYVQNRKISGRLMVMWVGQCIGAVLLLFAPGNALRASAYAYDSMIVELIRRFAITTVYGVIYLGVLFSAVIISGMGFRGNVKRLGYALVLAFGALIAVYAMVGSPELSDRTYTGPFVLMLSSLLVILADADEQGRKLGAAKLIVFPLFLIVSGYIGYHAVQDVSSFESAWKGRVAVIETAKEENRDQVEIEALYSNSRFTMDVVHAPQASQWPNTSISKVYGIDVIGK